MTELVASPDDFVVRPATDDDIGYVKKTWLRDFADGGDGWIDDHGGGEVYFAEHHKQVECAVERGAVTIACRRAVPTGICGFAVTERDIVHYVYVKTRWRKLGVAKLLLGPLLDRDAVYTHWTRAVRILPVPKSWKFNPYPFLRST